jgi:hypothetical protein
MFPKFTAPIGFISAHKWLDKTDLHPAHFARTHSRFPLETSHILQNPMKIGESGIDHAIFYCPLLGFSLARPYLTPGTDCRAA